MKSESYDTEQSKKNGSLPLVSIGLPTYNGEKRIVSTLTSVLNQKYPNLEVIISDNCSSDNTEAVCKELCKKNQVIHYFRQKENIGIIPNFEFVLSKASGDFFMWVADDDSLEPGILQKYVDFLNANPDYSLVSGEIRYWRGVHTVFVERDFSMDHNSRNIRVIRYYSKVKHGAIYYGLMPLEIAKKIALQNRMGEDWHFVAKAAYLGKIKMLDCIGYNKKLDGSSKTLKQYAKIIRASWFTTNFPHVQIAIDAFYEIMTSSIYEEKRIHSKLILALASSVCILSSFYCKEFPFIVGGKIVRLLGFKKRMRTSPNSLKEEWAS
ncbi:MAG: glycosyltransferase family 2 protein [Bacteroidetes bacterium]|nr:glycosyltransferase family 2 protein [Bacteroidota bacterium]